MCVCISLVYLICVYVIFVSFEQRVRRYEAVKWILVFCIGVCTGLVSELLIIVYVGLCLI